MNNISVKIDQLFFDPNNYRLRNEPNYKLTPQSSILGSVVQKKTKNLICGKNNKSIIDLIESFKSNGYLKVDNILVRKVKKDKYLIIEGNRRIATIKYLKELYEKGEDIENFNPSLFDKIDVVLYSYKDEKDYLILMGLKHVSGNKKWERYNQAKLLYELKSTMKLEDWEIAAKLAIPKSQVQREIRGYIVLEKFIKEIQNENYTDFNPYDKIMIMIELTSKPKLRNWVGWDDNKEDFSKKNNLKRFFSWITPTYDWDEDTEEYEPQDPIIISHKQVRELNEIIDDEEALEIMEEERSFKSAIEQNTLYTKRQFTKTIKSVEKTLKNVTSGSALSMSADDRRSLNNIINICKKWLAS
jgi:5'-3' exonuclease